MQTTILLLTLMVTFASKAVVACEMFLYAHTPKVGGPTIRAGEITANCQHPTTVDDPKLDLVNSNPDCRLVEPFNLGPLGKEQRVSINHPSPVTVMYFDDAFDTGYVKWGVEDLNFKTRCSHKKQATLTYVRCSWDCPANIEVATTVATLYTPTLTPTPTPTPTPTQRT